MRILIVDDTKSVHAFMKAILAPRGITLEAAYNGKEALSILKTSPAFDLIFLDWEMPEMDGITTLREIRIFDKNTPIIFVTSRQEITCIQDALLAGAQEYVMKPFTEDILIEKAQSVTGRVLA